MYIEQFYDDDFFIGKSIVQTVMLLEKLEKNFSTEHNLSLTPKVLRIQHLVPNNDENYFMLSKHIFIRFFHFSYFLSS
jgi:hypothetical protein